MSTSADPSRDAEAAIDLLDRAAASLRADAKRHGCAVRLPGRGRLLATGDLHDNPLHLEKVIRLAGLGEPDHHVVLHELIHGERLINGMDFSYRMLLKVAELVLAHPGQVHPLLANHELAQMTGRGVSKGAGDSVQLFKDAVDFVYGDEAPVVDEAIARFIAALPLALLSEGPEGGVCCAHSLPNARLMHRFDLDVLGRDLTPDDYASPFGSAFLMTWGRAYTDEQVEQLARQWGVRLFCLGHLHVEHGADMRGPRVLVLNTDHERAAVLPVDLARVPEAATALGSVVPLAAA